MISTECVTFCTIIKFKKIVKSNHYKMGAVFLSGFYAPNLLSHDWNLIFGNILLNWDVHHLPTPSAAGVDTWAPSCLASLRSSLRAGEGWWVPWPDRALCPPRAGHVKMAWVHRGWPSPCCGAGVHFLFWGGCRYWAEVGLECGGSGILLSMSTSCHSPLTSYSRTPIQQNASCDHCQISSIDWPVRAQSVHFCVCVFGAAGAGSWWLLSLSGHIAL